MVTFSHVQKSISQFQQDAITQRRKAEDLSAVLYPNEPNRGALFRVFLWVSVVPVFMDFAVFVQWVSMGFPSIEIGTFSFFHSLPIQNKLGWLEWQCSCNIQCCILCILSKAESMLRRRNLEKVLVTHFHGMWVYHLEKALPCLQAAYAQPETSSACDRPCEMTNGPVDRSTRLAWCLKSMKHLYSDCTSRAFLMTCEVGYGWVWDIPSKLSHYCSKIL